APVATGAERGGLDLDGRVRLHRFAGFHGGRLLCRGGFGGRRLRRRARGERKREREQEQGFHQSPLIHSGRNGASSGSARARSSAARIAALSFGRLPPRARKLLA